MYSSYNYERLIEVLKNFTWNGQKIKYIHDDLSKKFKIPLSQFKEILDINKEYKNITGKIDIYYRTGYAIQLVCPCLKEDAVSKIREMRWQEYLVKTKKPGIWGLYEIYTPYKSCTKTYTTTKKISETITEFLDMSVTLVKQGYEWSISDSVKQASTEFIKHRKILCGLNNKLDKIEKQVNNENYRFGGYHSKYMDNFRKIIKMCKDFT